MKKLVYLLAIPIIALSSCYNSERIPNPEKVNYECEINGEKFHLYENFWRREYVLEIRRKDGSQVAYIGNRDNREEVESVEIKKGFETKKYKLEFLSEKAKEKVKEQYAAQLYRLLTQKEKNELEMLKRFEPKLEQSINKKP